MTNNTVREIIDTIYLVEFRDYYNKQMSSDVAYLASSLEKALEFIKQNADYGNEEGKWWWAVYPMSIDRDDNDFEELYFFNPIGERIYWQPSYDQIPVSLNNKYSFDLSSGNYSYLNGWNMSGTLIKTDDEKLTFDNVQYYQNDKLIKTINKETFDLHDLHGLYVD